jgi:hypothetical protein
MLSRLIDIIARKAAGAAGRAANLIADPEMALVLPPRLIADTLAFQASAGARVAARPDIAR